MKYYNITVNGVAYSVSVEETAAGAAPVAAPAAPAAPKAPAAPAAAPKAAAPAGAAGAVTVKAPMPGNILDVKVAAGASVKAGDVLVILEAMKYYNITVNGVAYSVSVEETAAGAAPVAAPAAPAAPKAPAAPAAAPKAAAPAGAAGAVTVKAPMPGNILDVKVAAGASVKAGDVLVILEAMKMENEIVAPQDGTVASVNVNKGDTVNSGDVLVSMN